MTTFGHISGQEPSTISFKAATVTINRNSTVMHQEIVSLGDPVSSGAIAECSSLKATSSQTGLVTRPVWSSTNADQPVSAAQASTVWQVQINGNSTVIFAPGYVSSAVLPATRPP